MPAQFATLINLLKAHDLQHLFSTLHAKSTIAAVAAQRQPAPPKVPDRVEPGSKLVVVQARAAAMRSRRVWNRREWPPRVTAV